MLPGCSIPLTLATTTCSFRPFSLALGEAAHFPVLISEALLSGPEPYQAPSLLLQTAHFQTVIRHVNFNLLNCSLRQHPMCTSPSAERTTSSVPTAQPSTPGMPRVSRGSSQERHISLALMKVVRKQTTYTRGTTVQELDPFADTAKNNVPR